MEVEPIVCQECSGWDDDWETPLYRACLSEHSECFKALLQQENLQPGSQSLASEPRGSRDRASRQGAELEEMSDDDHSAGKRSE